MKHNRREDEEIDQQTYARAEENIRQRVEPSLFEGYERTKRFKREANGNAKKAAKKGIPIPTEEDLKNYPTMLRMIAEEKVALLAEYGEEHPEWKARKDAEAQRDAEAARALAELQNSPRQQNKRNPSICPKCGSSDTVVLGSTNRPSVGRAIVGGAIAGRTGAAIGGLTGKKMRTQFLCRSCGHRWTVKV
jgi:hypothetical protein